MEKRRILIIDDEVGFARLVKLNLEETGAYEVRVENAGKRALAAAREFRPDLILLDIVMPDMGGGDVASQIKADGKLHHTPIVFLTASVTSEEVDAEGGMIAGHPFIAKPVEVTELVEYIERSLGKYA